MNKKNLVYIAISSALMASAVHATESSDNSILVLFKPGVAKQQRLDVVQNAGGILRQLDADGRDLKMRYVADGRIVKVQLPQGADRDRMIKKLSANPAIEIAEPDFKQTTLAVPDDARFSELWAMQNTGQNGGTAGADIKAVDAWDISTGSHDVVIGIIDTGMDYNHPDLQANRWVNPGNMPGSTYGYSTLNAAQDPMDSDSHGTHVAGTIGASGNNAAGVTGVNWNVTLIPCQFLGPTGGSTSGAIECINYFTDLKLNYGVDVKATNNSWGGGGYSDTLRAAIQSAGEAGILFVAAAGNDGVNADSTPMYPAAYDLDVIVSVASTDRNDNLSIFSSGASNYGAVSVDLGAPGSAILSTIPGGGYASYSGTSMASPHVAGAAALLWSLDPDISTAEMKSILMNSGDALASLDGKTASGKRLNLSSAIADADPTPSFRLSLTPRTQQIVAGETATFTLDVGSIAEWTGQVDLAVTVEPALDNVSLSVSSAEPGQTVTLQATTSAETPWGSYQFTVTGTDNASGQLVKSVDANLEIIPQGLQDYSYSNTTSVAIPDNDPVGITSIINVPQQGFVFGTEAGVNITHTWRGDLTVKLRSPQGTEHILHTASGGSADDLIESWQTPVFNAEQMQGDWTLVVSDNAGLDTGTLNSWSLTLTALSDDDNTPGPVAPVAAFSFNITDLSVSFTDQSTDADNDIVSWSWDFGDGNSSSEQSPQHSYAEAGNYSVTLTTSDSTGLSHSVTQQISLSDSDIVLSLHKSHRTRTGSTVIDLRWTSTAAAQVDLYRDNQLIDTVDDSGRYRDRFNSQASQVSYKICLAGTTTCSADLTVSF